MTPTLSRWVQTLLPGAASVSQRERLRVGCGALLGILLTGLCSAALLGEGAAALWLMAPMGASAVLLFGVPASPLTQPWSIVGGNLLAALIGVTSARFIGSPVVAASVSIFFSIGAMFALRCLHPPSGAIALTAVLGGAEIHAAGYGFVLWPVALNTVLLLLVAWLYNNATGRRYPHTQQADGGQAHSAEGAPAGPQSGALGFTSQDLQAAMKDYDQVLDVSFDDLEALVHRTEMHVFRRRYGETLCRDIMVTNVASVVFATELEEAWQLLASSGAQALPVLDRARHVIGIVTRADFLRHADLRDHRSVGQRLRAFLKRTAHTHSDKHEVVGQIMTSPATTARDTTPVVELVPLMAGAASHHLPIVDADRRLVGLVAQTHLIAALYDICLARLASRAA